MQQERYPESEQLYTNALRLLDASETRDIRLARTLYELAFVRKVLGRCGEASGLALRALSVFKTLPNVPPEEQAQAWYTIAGSYTCQHLPSRAEHAFRKAIVLDQNTPPAFAALHRAGLGDALMSEGKHAEALKAYQDAEAIFRRGVSDQAAQACVLSSVGEAYRILGRFQEADEKLVQGVALLNGGAATPSERSILVRLLYNLALLHYHQRRYEQAAVFYARAAAVADRGTNMSPRGIGKMLLEFGDCLRKTGHKPEGAALRAKAKALLRGPSPAEIVVDASQLRRHK